MATEKMYDLAFQFKRTKLWKQMLDSELFAVRLSDGEIGYCCVMGLAGEHIALAVYVGAEGFQSFRELAFRQRDSVFGQRDSVFEALGIPEPMDFSSAEWAFRQSCLQCSLENREELDEEDAENVRDYARRHKIQLRGPHSFPNFTKYMRYRIPWGIRTEEDERRICEGLAAAVALANLLETRRKSDLGIAPVKADTKTLPLLIPGERGYNVSRADVPKEWAETYPKPIETDKERITAVRKLRKKGVYACELLHLPGAIGADPDDELAPYFPVLLLCVDTKSGFPLTTQPVTDYDVNPEALRDLFADALISNGECPRAMKVRNEETLTLLEDFCMKAGILLSVDGDLPALDEMREKILGALYSGAHNFMDEDDDDFDFFDEDDDEDDEASDMDMEEAISDAMDQLMKMSDMELKSLPPMMVRQVLDMAPFGFVPQELQLRLRRLFKKF